MNIKSEFLLKEIKKNVFIIFMLLCTVLIGCALNLILPQVISVYLDKVHANEPNKLLIILACGYILLVCFSIAIKYLNIWLSEVIGWKISNNIRNSLLRHCVSLDIDFHKSHPSGEMIERIDTDSSYAAEFFSVFIAGFLGNIIILFGIIAIFMFQNLGLGILYFFLSIAILSIFSIFQKVVTVKWNNARNKEVKVYGYINEHIGGREDIKGVGSEIYTEKELNNMQNISRDAISNAAFFGNIPSTIFYSLLNLGEIGGIGIGAYLFLHNSMPLSKVYVIVSYIGLINAPFMELRYQFEELQKISAAINRTNELFKRKSSITYGQNQVNVEKGVSVSIGHLSFAYDDNKILNNINLNINKGEVVGIVGRTGSGKTTLMNLITKLYENNDGYIRFNGVDIKSISKKNYENIVYSASQNVCIFHATLRENISLFSNRYSDLDIINALKLCGLYEWYSVKEKGLNTIIDKSDLSVGEAQLISLTRAVLAQPKIFVFDEITAYIDRNTEQRIMEALAKIIQNKTVFMVLHKTELLKYVDKVAIMKNGYLEAFAEKTKISDSMLRRYISEE